MDYRAVRFFFIIFFILFFFLLFFFLNGGRYGGEQLYEFNFYSLDGLTASVVCC
jgi:hypothetical protein